MPNRLEISTPNRRKNNASEATALTSRRGEKWPCFACAAQQHRAVRHTARDRSLDKRAESEFAEPWHSAIETASRPDPHQNRGLHAKPAPRWPAQERTGPRSSTFGGQGGANDGQRECCLTQSIRGSGTHGCVPVPVSPPSSSTPLAARRPSARRHDTRGRRTKWVGAPAAGRRMPRRRRWAGETTSIPGPRFRLPWRPRPPAGAGLQGGLQCGRSRRLRPGAGAPVDPDSGNDRGRLRR
jgi:hypothetical protein